MSMEELDQEDKELLAIIENKPYRKYTLLELQTPAKRNESLSQREDMADKLEIRLERLLRCGYIQEVTYYYSAKAKL